MEKMKGVVCIFFECIGEDFDREGFLVMFECYVKVMFFFIKGY